MRKRCGILPLVMHEALTTTRCRSDEALTTTRCRSDEALTTTRCRSDPDSYRSSVVQLGSRDAPEALWRLTRHFCPQAAASSTFPANLLSHGTTTSVACQTIEADAAESVIVLDRRLQIARRYLGLSGHVHRDAVFLRQATAESHRGRPGHGAIGLWCVAGEGSRTHLPCPLRSTLQPVEKRRNRLTLVRTLRGNRLRVILGTAR
jgi:hypothetical protein